MKVRPTHLANVLASDRLELAGGIASDFPPPVDGAVPDFKGSAIIVKADSRDDAIAFLKQDVYVAEGVWDVDNAQVFAVSIQNKNLKQENHHRKWYYLW